jgi:type II secretory pathway component PulF
MERRLNYRLAALGQALFPLLILAMGAVVLLFVVAWFLPLIDLIHSLAQPGGHAK